jgi:hypothetical protein
MKSYLASAILAMTLISSAHAANTCTGECPDSASENQALMMIESGMAPKPIKGLYLGMSYNDAFLQLKKIIPKDILIHELDKERTIKAIEGEQCYKNNMKCIVAGNPMQIGDNAPRLWLYFDHNGELIEFSMSTAMMKTLFNYQNKSYQQFMQDFTNAYNIPSLAMIKGVSDRFYTINDYICKYDESDILIKISHIQDNSTGESLYKINIKKDYSTSKFD